MEQKELKNVMRSVRMTETVYEYIDQFRGKNFNDKFENMVLYFHTEAPKYDLEIINLQKEVAELYAEREKLTNDLQILTMSKKRIENVIDTLSDLNQVFKTESEQFERRNIEKMINNNHMISNENILSEFIELDKITNRKNNLKDIAYGYEKKNFKKEFGDQAQVIVDKLYEEFHKQQKEMSINRNYINLEIETPEI